MYPRSPYSPKWQCLRPGLYTHTPAGIPRLAGTRFYPYCEHPGLLKSAGTPIHMHQLSCKKMMASVGALVEVHHMRLPPNRFDLYVGDIKIKTIFFILMNIQ